LTDSATQLPEKKDRPAVPASLQRDVEALDDDARDRARRLLDVSATELADMKQSWAEDLLSVHEEFERACERIREERYQPVRRDELLQAAREEFLGRLQRGFEKQNRQTSDYCLSLARRMRAAVAPAERRNASRSLSMEAALLRELLDLSKRSHVANLVARGDRREIADSWRRAESDNDTVILDLISAREGDDLPAGAIEYRRRKNVQRRVADAEELVSWVQRERTVAHAVYDSIVEAISRS